MTIMVGSYGARAAAESLHTETTARGRERKLTGNGIGF